MANPQIINRILRLEAQTQGLAQTQRGLQGVINLANRGISTFGGLNLSLKSFINYNNDLNKSLLALRGSFAKYDVGVAQLERRIEKFSKQNNMLRKEVIQLASAYEKGFISAGPKFENFFKMLQRVVGNNAEAMQELQGRLQSVSKEFIGFEKIITGIDNSGNLRKNNMEMLQSFEAYMMASRNFSVDRIKTIRDVIAGNKEVSAIDAQRRKELNSQVEAFRRLERIGEDVARMMSQQIAPVLEKIGNLLDRAGDSALKLVGTITMLSGGLSAALLTRGAMGGLGIFGKGGAAAAGAGGAGAAGTAGAIGIGGIVAGAAAGTAGFMGGEYLGNELYGVHDAARGAISIAGASSILRQERFGSSTNPAVQNALKNIAAKEKELLNIRSAKGRGPIDHIRNIVSGGAHMRKTSRESEVEKELSALRQILSREAAKAESIKKSSAERSKAVNKAYEELYAIALLDQNIKSVSDTLKSQTGLYEIIVSTITRMGDVDSRNLNIINSQQKAIEERLVQQESMLDLRLIESKKFLDNAKDHASILRDQGMQQQANDLLMKAELEARQTVLGIEKDRYELARQSIEISFQRTRINDKDIETESTRSSLMRTQIELADNLAMGVAASAEMRVEMARQIGREVVELRQRLGFIDQERKHWESVLQDQNSSEMQRLAAQQGLKQLGIDRLKVEGEIMSKVHEQARVTRALRDGWISAINAMSTGTGMFTKIAIDANTRVGTLMASAPEEVVGIATGAARRAGQGMMGLTGSTRYSPTGVGVLTNFQGAGARAGAPTAAWGNKLVHPIPAVGGGSAAAAGNIAVSLLEEIANNTSGAMAGAAGALYGTSGLAGNIGQSVGNALKISEKEIAKEFAHSMKNVARAAADQAMEEIQKGIR